MRRAAHGVGVEERLHGDGHAVLHTWLQVPDDDLLFVGDAQPELQPGASTHKLHTVSQEDGFLSDEHTLVLVSTLV